MAAARRDMAKALSRILELCIRRCCRLPYRSKAKAGNTIKVMSRSKPVRKRGRLEGRGTMGAGDPEDGTAVLSELPLFPLIWPDQIAGVFNSRTLTRIASDSGKLFSRAG